MGCNLISVIVPVYNVENYVSECIASIVAQEYCNLEIILVDDGSTDQSGIICDEWAQKDDRIRVIHKDHKGVSEARNIGLLECKGQLIGFVDADDWLEPNMYQVLVDAMFSAKADIVICGFYYHQQRENKPIEFGTSAVGNRTFEETIFLLLKRRGSSPSLWNKLYRKEVIISKDKSILMNPALSYGEDEAWLFEVLQNCNRITFISQVLYNYRAREGSLSRTKDLSAERMSLLEAKKVSLAQLPQSADVMKLFKGNIFNCVHGLKVLSYIKKDMVKLRYIHEYLKPFGPAWIKSHEVRALRKLKVLLLEFCMKTRMPIAVVKKINDLRKP